MKNIKFGDELSFSEHLEELRCRVIYIAAAVITGFLICYAMKDTILYLLMSPLPSKHRTLTFLAPAEAFIVVLKISFFSGIALSSPLIFYHVWCFVCPALLKKEKKYIVPAAIFSVFFFLIGILFAYFVILPLGLNFLLTYGERFGVPNITLSNYLSFSIKLMLAFGFVFELPLVITVLTRFGIINSKTLSKNRGNCIICIFIISALLTPPDVATQVLMSVPLLGLFELSILISKIFEKRNNG